RNWNRRTKPFRLVCDIRTPVGARLAGDGVLEIAIVGTPPGPSSAPTRFGSFGRFFCRRVQIHLKPVASQAGDFLQGSWFFKKVGGSGDDVQPVLTLQGQGALAVKAKHRRVLISDDL